MAGERSQQAQIRRHGSSGSPICENVVALAGYQNPFANPARGSFRCRRLLSRPHCAASSGERCFMATQVDPVRYDYPLGTTPERSKSSKFHARQSPSDLVRVGVIGYGYWGPNVVRNLQSLENCQLVTICDKNSDSLRRAGRVYPGVELTMDFSELLTSPQIDAATGRGANRVGGAEQTQNHGGSHVPVQWRSEEDPRARRRRHLGRSLLF